MGASPNAAGGATEHTSGNISSSAAGGATEHTSGNVLEGVLAFSNIGLAPQQVRARAARPTARRDYHMTLDLHNQLLASKGQKGRGDGEPTSYGEMSWGERWWLRHPWQGELRRALGEAEGRCRRAQAPVAPSASGMSSQAF